MALQYATSLFVVSYGLLFYGIAIFGWPENIVLDIIGCGGIHDIGVNEEVTIQSKNFPNNYDVNANCRWIFKVRLVQFSHQYILS